jgi:hypothetical protein
MHDQNPASNSLFVYGKQLFQEWLVDQYCKVESQRLSYLRTHQDSIRADLYQGLADALHEADGELDMNNIGRRVILPSSFTGGPHTCSNSIMIPWLLFKHRANLIYL